ncbi:protein RRP5 homolog isoform X2 [Sycon ciliatum]|uniref:protein RRP5 homolog isoform X2 n=1 Tax=Sycon ciliatum TaxID=27933 RepID=UPI0031F6D717
MDGEDFPRGGQATISQLERREIARQAKSDVLFRESTDEKPDGKADKYAEELEAAEVAKKPRPKKRKRDVQAPGVKEKDAEAAAEKRKFSVDVLSFKKLSVGMLMLGAVNEITDFELIVSLPHGLSGYVRPTDVSPQYTEALLRAAEAAEIEAAKGDASDSEDDEETPDSDAPALNSMFHVGQLLTCIIKETHSTKDVKKRRIRLSLHSAEINQSLSSDALRPGVTVQGHVSSIEEHGYLIEFGLKRRTAFLHNRRAKTYSKLHNGDRPLVLGQPVRCLVLECDADTRVVPVTINPTEVAEAVANSDCVTRFTELTPGMMVSGKILQRAPNGAAMSFLSGIAGMISTFHLPQQLFNASQLPPSKKIKARIIHVNLTSKVVGFSAQQHIVENKAYTFPDLQLGGIVEEAAVKHVEENVGVVIKMTDAGMHGFVHISNLSDDHLEKIGKRHKTGTVHKCRILGFNSLDGLASASMQQSILDRPFLGLKDVVLGTSMKVEVISIETSGVVVAVSDHLRGFIPLMHLADIPLKKPGKKFREGGKVACRILEVTPARRRLLLTAKKTMVRSELPVLSKISEALVGSNYTGFVAGIRHYGLIVAFYGGTTGLLHRTELSVSTFDDDLGKMYYVGQVLQCRVISVDHGKLRLSLKAHGAASSGIAGLSPGEIFPAKYSSTNDKGIDVLLQPSNKPVTVTLSHLSDFPQHCEQLARCIASSQGEAAEFVLERLAVLGCRPLLVSCKPSLVPAEGEDLFLPTLASLKVGQILVGFVRQVVAYGVFVELASQLVGLVPVKSVADEFVTHPADLYSLGQTVVVQVTEVDTVKQRFILSMKPSDLGAHSGPSLPTLLEQFWREKSAIDQCLSQSSAKRQAVHDIAVGSLVECEYVRSQPFGASLKVCGSGATAIAPTSLAEQAESLTAGDIVTAAVLDKDVENATVYVSLDADLVKVWSAATEVAEASATTRKEKKRKDSECSAKDTPSQSAVKASKVGEFTEGIVQLIKPDCVVLTLPQFGSAVALGLAHQHLNDYRPASKRYSPGQKLKTEIVRLPSASSPFALVSLGRLPRPPKQTSDGSPRSSDAKVAVGDVVSAMVRSVQGLQLNVRIGGKLLGRVHVTQFTDKPAAGKWPFADVHNGDEIKCRVIGFRKLKSNRHLEISHHDFYEVAELSAKESVVENDSLDEATLKDKDLTEELVQELKPGSRVTAFVKEVWKSNLNLLVTPTVRATLPLLEAATTKEAAANPDKYFQPGSAVTATVTKFIKADRLFRLAKSVEVCIGEVRTCRIAKVIADEALLLELPGVKTFARCALTDISDSYEEDPLSNYPCHMIARCYILEKQSSGQLDVSLRPSRTSGSSSSNNGTMPDTASDAERHGQSGTGATATATGTSVRDPEIESIADIKQGQILRGYVKAAVDNAGLFVRLSRNIVGRAKITNLSENFVKNWKKAYPVGKLVVTKVMAVDYNQSKIELSLRNSHISPQKRKRKTSDSKDADGQSGKRTKLTGGRVLAAADADSDDDNEVDSDAELRQMMEEEGAEMLTSDSESEDDVENGEQDSEDADVASQGSDQDTEDDDSDTDSDDDSATPAGKSSAACLKLPSKFDWWSEAQASAGKQAAAAGAASDSSSDDEDGEENMSNSQRKKTRRQKRAEKKQDEANLRAMEETLLDTERPMQTVQDFERLVAANPDESDTWIQFMACHMHSAEIDKARAVAQRALETLNFRNEKGKLDIWVTWLNLENVYGSHESLMKVFDEAVRTNEPEKVFFRLVRIYIQSKKFERADDLYATMVKRFSQSREVWEQYGLFKFRQGKPDAARRLMDRGLKSLRKFEHVDVISKFAQLEFKHGEVERGRTMFESLVTNYPKRVDLWSIYIDMLLRDEHVDDVRAVFERLINIQLSSKKMKHVFKRYLEFESKHGDTSTVAEVTKKLRNMSAPDTE